MKSLVLFALVALAAASPQVAVENPVLDLDGSEPGFEYNNVLVTILVRQLFNLLRSFIVNGAPDLGIPVLDPLNIEEYKLSVPTGLLNLELVLKNVSCTGLGKFVVHKSDLNLRDLTFDIEIGFPAIHAEAQQYDLTGDIFTAIPLYGKGGAFFNTDGFRFRAILFLKQSEDGRSILIEKIENPGFDLSHFKSRLDGAIGGGDIDAIVNAVIEEVIIDYVNRFHGVVAKVGANISHKLLNSILDGLNTWIFIAPLIPRQ